MGVSNASIRNTVVALGISLAGALALARPAGALVIDPTFDVSVTSNPNAAAIEGAINTAISTIDGLYSNPVDITVKFTYNPGPSGDLENTTQSYYGYSYSSYVGALKADAAANPENTVLGTAVANLSAGNGANGHPMALTGADSALLALYGLASPGASDATININSSQTFATSRPVPSNEYDLIGGLEHELDEVLGGGGGGSTLNNCAHNAVFCNFYGPLDLYRYSRPGTGSYTQSSTATSYFSIDGGVTNIEAFNQNPNGDYGDFLNPNLPCTPAGSPGQLIQYWYSCTGQYEAYTTSSLEFEMMEAIGWDPIPEPGTLALLAAPLFGIGLVLRRRA